MLKYIFKSENKRFQKIAVLLEKPTLRAFICDKNEKLEFKFKKKSFLFNKITI